MPTFSEAQLASFGIASNIAVALTVTDQFGAQKTSTTTLAIVEAQHRR